MAAPNDVWRFSLVQSLFNQEVINTFAFRVVSDPNELNETDLISELWGGQNSYFNLEDNLREEIRLLQSDQVIHNAWRVNRVQPNPTQDVDVQINFNVSGANPGLVETPNTAMSITRKGLFPGRRSKGRIAIAGIPTTSIAGGRFSLNTLADAQAVGFAICGQKNAGDGLVIEMGYWVPEHDGVVAGQTVLYPAIFVPTVNWVVRDTVRTQRSRTIGVGS